MTDTTFPDGNASRILAAIDGRIDRRTKNGATVQTTWGTIGSISAYGDEASAYLYGETDGAYLSGGFRIPEATYLTVGDVVKVAINYATGERWIMEVNTTATEYKKMVFDLSTGQVLTGDGTAAPTYANFVSDIETEMALGTFAYISSLAHSSLTGITATDHHPAPAAGPDADITIDTAGAAGTASTFARSGHGHKITTYSSTPAHESVSGSAGTSTTAPARGDHSHPRTAPIRRVYSSSTSWSKPANLSHIEVEVQGGGGGGGGAANAAANEAAVASGGGGGGYAKKLLLATDLTASTYTVTVGTYGSGGSAGANNGAAGNPSYFVADAGDSWSTVTGNGGGAGLGCSSQSAHNIVGGGTGGTGANGDINIYGGDGGNGITVPGRNAAGTYKVWNIASGYGGGAALGGLARASATDTGGAGSAGTAYGGGGAGATSQNASGSNAGGNGAAGRVIITEFYL